mmetsp:Transcript_1470/g.2414  ORF Transcript_1470/g.2414 Transcript_1470/m.2414 type:complete len:404 (-) Transcript_1470:152-1363(-)
MFFKSTVCYIVALIVAIDVGAFRFSRFFATNSNLRSSTNIIVSFQHDVNKESSRRFDLQMSTQAFNPFSNRNKNSHVQWFEADLTSFYDFVEDQPLLTAEQELQYGKAVSMWSRVEKMRTQLQEKLARSTPLSDTEMAIHMDCSERTLEKMAKYSEIAKGRLVDSNLKLVLAVVSRYRSSEIPNSELIAEGTRGLARAAIRYDYSKGFRFATYATWYVHQAVSEYVRWRKHPAKMPSRYTLLRRKVKQFSTNHKEATGVQPSISQIAHALGQSHFDVIKVMSMQSYPALLCSPIQSEGTRNEGRDRTLEDVLPSLYKAPLAQSSSKDLRRDMEEMMQSNLNDVERDVLRLRLGLDDGRVKPIKEVGKRFKISWKQVRNVEKEAISKLLESEQITDFVDSYHSV